MAPIPTTRKVYLGDGTTVALSEFGDVVLTTDDSRYGPVVVLGPEQLAALLRYLEAQELIAWTPFTKVTR